MYFFFFFFWFLGRPSEQGVMHACMAWSFLFPFLPCGNLFLFCLFGAYQLLRQAFLDAERMEMGLGLGLVSIVSKWDAIEKWGLGIGIGIGICIECIAQAGDTGTYYRWRW